MLAGYLLIMTTLGVAQPKLSVPGVGWSAYVLDSEGNTIGLFQPDTSANAGR